MPDEIATVPVPINNGGLTKYRQDQIDKILEGQEKKINDLEDKVNDMRIDLARMQERITIFQAAQAIFTTVAGVVASFIGRL